MLAAKWKRSKWEIFDASGGPYRTGLGETEAHDIVLIDANVNGAWVKNYDTGAEIHWSDVCSEPWPSDETGYPYGTPPEGWPYGNGC